MSRFVDDEPPIKSHPANKAYRDNFDDIFGPKEKSPLTENQCAYEYTYHTRWSEEDKEYVGLVDEFPSLSWLAPTPGEAIEGIKRLVAEAIADFK
jgi:predicted RNase H-like HicB family nuclease